MTKYPNGIDDNTNIPPVTPDSIGPLIGPPGPQGIPGPRGIPGPGGGIGAIQVKNHGTAIPNNPHSSINFTGSGVTATDVGGVATITITGGGGGGGFTPGGDLTGDGTTQIVSFIQGIPTPDPNTAAPYDVFTIAPANNLWAGAAGIVYDGQFLWVSDGDSSGANDVPDARVHFLRIIDPVPVPPVLVASVDLSAFAPYQNVRQIRMSNDNTKIYACILGWDGSNPVTLGDLQCSAPVSGVQTIFSNSGQFYSKLVGSTITITFGQPGNIGTFTILSFIDPTQITISNPGGELDTDASHGVTNTIPGRVLVIDKVTRTVVGNAVMKNGIIGTSANVAIGARACVENAGTLWVTNSNQQQGNIVEKFDLATVLANGTSPTLSFDFVNIDQHAEELCFLSGFIWTGGAAYTNDITRINPSDNSTSTFTCLPSGTGGQNPFISPVALFGALWAGDFGENIMRFDPAQFPGAGFRTDVFDLGGGALSTDAQSQFLSDGTFLWHANLGNFNGPNCFYKIDPTPGAISLVTTINYNGGGVQEIAFDGNNHIWGTQRFNGVNSGPSSLVKANAATGLEAFELFFSSPPSPIVWDLPALYFADSITSNRSNIVTSRVAASHTESTIIGATNLGSDSTLNIGHVFGVYADYGSILGGDKNAVYSLHGAVCGGLNNIAYQQAGILGGNNNTASGFFSTICGGQNNAAQNTGDAVIAGQNNLVGSGFGNSGIFTGQQNSLGGGGDSCVILGGSQNAMSSNGTNYSAIAGGFQNTINASFSFIGGGNANTIQSAYNAAFGIGNVVFGGGGNLCTGFNNQVNSSVSLASGQANLATGQWSTALGDQAKAKFPGQLAISSGAVDNAGAYADVTFAGDSQSSIVNVQLGTPGSTTNESAELLMAGESHVGGTSGLGFFLLEDGKAYDIDVTMLAAGTIAGVRNSRTFKQSCNVQQTAGTVTIIATSGAVTTYGTAGSSTWNMTISAGSGPARLKIVFNTGSTTVLSKVIARVIFTELKF